MVYRHGVEALERFWGDLMAGIWIGEHYEFINDEEDFFTLVREKIGRDAEQFGRELFNTVENHCTGECDYTYRVEEHYVRMFKDFLDELSGIKVLKSYQRAFSNLILKYQKEF